MKKSVDVLKESLQLDEVKNFMLGINGYRYEDKMCSGPTNVVLVTEAFSDLKNITSELKVDEIFEKTLYEMLDGDPWELYMAMNYYRIQLNCHRIKINPMEFNHNKFKKKLKETLLRRKNELMNINSFDNRNLSGTLWDYIIKLNSVIEDINQESIL